jgi:colicin import membrane protein
MNQQSQQKEDSVLFSLRSLMAIEDDRLRQEDDARQQAAAMERARADEARRREESEAAAQRRAEVDARAADERQRREAEAQAAREREESALRIRLEAESRRQERELALRLEQEQRLATIAAQQQRRGVHPGALGLGALALAAAMGAGTFFGVVKPMREAAAAATQRAELARRDADERRVLAERSVVDARRQVAEAEAARRRATADAQLAAQNAARVTPPSAVRPVVGASHPRPSRVARPPTVEPEIIGDIDGELPGSDRH